MDDYMFDDKMSIDCIDYFIDGWVAGRIESVENDGIYLSDEWCQEILL